MLHFKQLSLVLPVALIAATLAACGQTSSNNAAKSSSVSTSSSTAASYKDSDFDHSNEGSPIATVGNDNSTLQNSPAAKEALNRLITAQPLTQRNRIKVLNNDLQAQLGQVALPQVTGLGQGSQNLNIAYTGNHNNYTINYTVGDTPLAFNSPIVNKQNPYAVLQKQTFNSANEAKQQISYIVAEDTFRGMPVTGLKSGITAFYDQGAGHSNLYWNEGNWSLGVKANSLADQKPDPLAHQTLDLLDQYYLPAPKSVGQISFNSTITPRMRDQVIKWQDGNIVFTLTAHDPETAIKMAASIH
ncbi:hypothetical protein KAR50_06535 [Periweissella fabaria]|uniref:Lipoprotein n=1 Tax=Periweissella fabaria TaxID=546157 RepID=A0ABN8BKR1_9LACO|nr:hypothetical protein [Periweissella fabaria]MCM0597499.1 hypothetical protein [Periweissella fabaria]CAH0415999.1 hypothetical protein WFA24289_00298 [Periweissella fabaria]